MRGCMQMQNKLYMYSTLRVCACTRNFHSCLSSTPYQMTDVSSLKFQRAALKLTFIFSRKESLYKHADF